MLKQCVSSIINKWKIFSSMEIEAKKRCITSDNRIKICSFENTLNINFQYTNPLNKQKKSVILNPLIGVNLNNMLDRIKKKVAQKIKKKNAETPFTICLYNGDQKVLSEKTIKVDKKFIIELKNYHLLLQGKEYWFDINPPTIDKFNLSTRIPITGYPIYPVNIESTHDDVNVFTFSWYTSLISTVGTKIKILQTLQYEKVHEGIQFIPQQKDAGKVLMVIGKYQNEDDYFGYSVYSKEAIEIGPTDLPYLQRHQHTKEFSPNDSLRFVSYNLLAHKYSDSVLARTHLFSHCTDKELSIHYRKHLLIEEIFGYKGDIICLQEVDGFLFKQDLSELTISRNLYSGLYCEKNEAEGLSTFYRKDKLKLIDTVRYSLTNELKCNPLFSKTLEALMSNTNLWTTLNNIHTVLQATIMEHVNENKILVVGNTHLYFKPENDNIRLLQSEICLTLLRQLLAMYEAKNPDRKVALCFCGDFNSCPPDGIYRYMTTGFIADDDVDWSSCDDQKIEGVSLSHDLQLKSACGTPDYTTYTQHFVGCIDYIYYESNKLEVSKVMPLQSHEEVQRKALPNELFPSDHLALVAELKWR